MMMMTLMMMMMMTLMMMMMMMMMTKKKEEDNEVVQWLAGVSAQYLGIASWNFNICLSVAARPNVSVDPYLVYAARVAGFWATSQHLSHKAIAVSGGDVVLLFLPL